MKGAVSFRKMAPNVEIFLVEEVGAENLRLHWHYLARTTNGMEELQLENALLYWEQKYGFYKDTVVQSHEGAVSYVVKYVNKTSGQDGRWIWD